MGLLQRMFGREKEEEDRGPPPECTHASLVARWDNPDDIGKEDRASEWLCNSCGNTFSPTERTQIMSAEAERVRQIQDENDAFQREQERIEAEEAEAAKKD